MPIYRYEHKCGYNGDQFLKQDKESIVLPCARCGQNVTARQVRDKTTVINENNEVRGIFRHDNTQGGSGNANQH